jgi:hypothetical protein
MLCHHLASIGYYGWPGSSVQAGASDGSLIQEFAHILFLLEN